AVDSSFAGSLLPVGFKLRLVIIALRLARPERYLLRRFGTAVPLGEHCLLDLFTALRERHNLSPRVALQLPGAIASGYLSSVAESLYFAREFGTIDCLPEGLRAVNIDGVHRAPLAIR